MLIQVSIVDRERNRLKEGNEKDYQGEREQCIREGFHGRDLMVAVGFSGSLAVFGPKNPKNSQQPFKLLFIFQ